MFRFALGRLLQAIPVLLVVITMTFMLVHSAPGGPFSADKAVPAEVLEALEAQQKLLTTGIFQKQWNRSKNTQKLECIWVS